LVIPAKAGTYEHGPGGPHATVFLGPGFRRDDDFSVPDHFAAPLTVLHD
jgi:hypothetical protein